MLLISDIRIHHQSHAASLPAVAHEMLLSHAGQWQTPLKHPRMAVEPNSSAEGYDPFLGYGSLIVALVLLHLGVFIFWLWQVTGATARRPKVAQD